jgi:hypothetical protein
MVEHTREVAVKIFNVRAGFATNSSSSHSIVMIPAGMRVGTDEHNRFEYGWEQFTLADQESKSAYFATQLYHALDRENVSGETAVQLMNSWLGTNYTADTFCSYGVDHQSIWGIFSSSDPVDGGFVKSLYQYVMRDDVVILGGNDNSDGQTPPDGSFENDITAAIQHSGEKRIRQDGDYWTLFSPSSGHKVRLSMQDDALPYVKSTYPELVDVKLTDHCLYKCNWCYQGSTPEGKHAQLSEVLNLVDTFSRMGVFEIAYGGGETTDHPNFAEIIQYTASKNIVPNFTTFGVKWSLDREKALAVVNHAGAIGVSVHNAKDLNKISKIRSNLDNHMKSQGEKWWKLPSIMAQHVVGSVDLAETAELLERCWQEGVNVLLLGYKNVGFGENFAPHDLTGLDLVLRLRQEKGQAHYNARFSMLGVDTAFVQQFDPILQELEIPSVLKTAEEGKFSMYVDAVTMRQGPSSYMPDQMVDVDTSQLRDSIAQAYITW